jgi:hypothetical protein
LENKSAGGRSGSDPIALKKSVVSAVGIEPTTY